MSASLPPKPPDKFRHGHAVWALMHAQTMVDYKAISMNLMHGDVRITDSIYAPLLGSEGQQRITDLGGAAGPVVSMGAPELSGQNLPKTELARALRALADGLAAGQSQAHNLPLAVYTRSSPTLLTYRR